MAIRALLLVGLLSAVVACGGGPAPTGNAQVARGRQLYQQACSVCHGATGAGMPGLGKGLLGNVFVRNRGEAELVGFLQVGRAASDPQNVTGVTMPPRGGNPNLTDADLAAIAAYLKSMVGNR
ncbi:MAG: cytochrome c [Thermoanaerobaculia bacterium]